MRVLHYGKYFPPYLGGIEKATYDLAEGLSKRSCEVDVLCFNAGRKSIIEASASGYRVMRSGVFANIASTPLSFENIFKFISIANQYDVIHVHLPNPVANLAVILAGTRARVVLHWHTDIVRQRNLLFFYDPLQRWLLRRADAIIATSPSYVNGSRWLKEYQQKVRVIPLGVDVGAMQNNIAKQDFVKQRFQGRRIVFALGRHVRYKGFEYLIRSAKYLPDNVVVVIGGDGELRSSLEEVVKAIGLENKVYLIGPVQHDDMAGAYFSACDIFCLPSISRTESFGLVQLEAMYFGKPIVSSDIPGSGVGWVNESGVSGIVVPPESPTEIADAIINILDNPDLYKKLSIGARKRYLQNFTVDQMVDRVHALYEELLGVASD